MASSPASTRTASSCAPSEVHRERSPCAVWSSRWGGCYVPTALPRHADRHGAGRVASPRAPFHAGAVLLSNGLPGVDLKAGVPGGLVALLVEPAGRIGLEAFFVIVAAWGSGPLSSRYLSAQYSLFNKEDELGSRLGTHRAHRWRPPQEIHRRWRRHHPDLPSSAGGLHLRGPPRTRQAAALERVTQPRA
jgi:hypothetical protein